MDNRGEVSVLYNVKRSGIVRRSIFWKSRYFMLLGDCQQFWGGK